jgi:pimeloyl-ACP methyl ester carboxylesterase
VEHRYEGRSIPTNLTKDCLSYASTIQALADYARILQVQLNPVNAAPVIAFGGSYGGMLTAWIRMKYPHLILGGVAASAPIGAFPQSANTKIDWSARVLAHGLDKPYPPNMDMTVIGGIITEAAESVAPVTTNDAGRTAHSGKPPQHGGKEGSTPQQKVENHCRTNLLAAWPLIRWMARNESTGILLKELFTLCQPLPDDDGESLLRWAQSIWFDLAEGSFPYPSSYIPFALLHKKVDLPAWPMQAACWKESLLYKDWGVSFHGADDSGEDVNYRITYGDSELTLSVDWDIVNLADTSVMLQSYDDHAARSLVSASKDIAGLLTSVRDAVSIWYNITKDVSCYDLADVAPNSISRTRLHTPWPKTGKHYSDPVFETPESSSGYRLNPEQLCTETMMHIGSWEPLCCNDEMNLVITEARGMGHDFFWPPSYSREIRTYEDIVRNVIPEPCPDPDGIFGYSKEPYEQWSTCLHTYYGGVEMGGHSNIVFSNGLLDPWSAGGVYEETDPVFQFHRLTDDRIEIQNITENDVVALIIPFGGHHSDLMYSSEADPACVREARRVEEWFIKKWMQDWQVNR